jgi:ABC-2 type transport system permease protein
MKERTVEKKLTVNFLNREKLKQVINKLQEPFRFSETYKNDFGVFRSMVFKEIGDHVRSWRVIILGSIIILTCIISGRIRRGCHKTNFCPYA